MRVVLALAGSAIALSGCATLSRGIIDEVAVISEPAGARVTTTLGIGCDATPCTLKVKRDAVFSVTVSKPGYGSRTVAVATRLSGTGAAMASENVATAGLGIVVDATTGAALDHVPNPVDVVLTSLASPKLKPAGRGASSHPAS